MRRILLGGIILGGSLLSINSLHAAPVCPTVNPSEDFKVAGKPTIYYLDARREYRYYPDMNVYKSWNGERTGVKVIPEQCLVNFKLPTTFPLAINMRPGSLMVRRASNDTLFAVLPGNTLAPLSSTTAMALYATSSAAVVSDREWPNYRYSATSLTEGVAHPGMLITYAKKYYWINLSGVAQEITARGLAANKLAAGFFKPATKTLFTKLKIGTRIDTSLPALTDKTQLSVIQKTTSTLPPPPPSSTPSPTAPVRDSTLHPFSSDSPWNTPLAIAAQFGDKNDLCTKDLTDQKIGTAINGSQWSHPVYTARETDPLVQIYSTTADLKKDKPLATIHIPKNATPALPDFSKNPDSDAHLHIIDPSAKEVHELWRAKWVGANKLTTWSYTKNSLTGSGIEKGGARAYGGSAIAGLIRTGELKNGIHHALSLAVPRAQQRLKNAPVWPATTIDDFAGKDYRGHIPMGQLVAVPANTDLSKLNLSTQGKALAEALKNFGAYNIDSSGEMTLYVETGAAGEMDKRLEEDWKKLRPLLKCVLNNRKDTVGGGGKGAKRLAAFPVPLSR